MTKQDILDKVVTHMLTQMEQSYENGDCLYRGPNGMMCAVGCLIKDEFYDEELENLPATSYQVQHAVTKSTGVVVDESMEDFLYSLQRIHDTNSPREWATKFKELAQIEGLTFNPPSAS